MLETSEANGGSGPIDAKAPILERPELKSQAERVRSQLQDLDKQLRRVVEERPLVAVGVALGFGYALGRLLARR